MHMPHRLHFLRFIEGTEGGQAGSQEPPATTAEPVTDPAVPAAGESEAKPTAEEQSTIDALPQWAQEEIRNLRKESGTYRNKAKEVEATLTQKDTEHSTLIDGLKKLFGEGEGEQSPEDLLAEANQRAETAAKELNDMRVSLAFREATDGVADAKVLLPYMKGAGLLDGLDPTAEDFTAQVAALVTKTVEEVPAFKVHTVSKSSGNAPTPTKPTGQISRDDLKAMTSHEIVEAKRAGKLNHLF